MELYSICLFFNNDAIPDFDTPVPQIKDKLDERLTELLGGKEDIIGAATGIAGEITGITVAWTTAVGLTDSTTFCTTSGDFSGTAGVAATVATKDSNAATLSWSSTVTKIGEPTETSVPASIRIFAINPSSWASKVYVQKCLSLNNFTNVLT